MDRMVLICIIGTSEPRHCLQYVFELYVVSDLWCETRLWLIAAVCDRGVCILTGSQSNRRIPGDNSRRLPRAELILLPNTVFDGNNLICFVRARR